MVTLDTPDDLSDVFMFDQFRLNGRGGGLFRRDAAGTWTPVAIGSRALDVLAVLAERHGELVSKDELMRAVWPGTTVEEKNLAVQISALRRVLDEGRAGESCIQTVPGRGYRLIRRVTEPEELAFEPASAPVANQPTLPEVPMRLRYPRWHWVVAGSGILALAVLLIIGAWRAGWHGSSAAPPRLSIVVLPFKNLGADRGEDYLADAVTEDVTTDLSRMPGMFVIARQSAYTYQGRAVHARKIGEELGVRYALEGSVRKMGDVLRVNAQLIATETGAHLWADRFDQRLEALSAGQEEVARRIGQTLNVTLMNVESARSRRERPTNPDAFDLIIRARSIGLRPMGGRERAERLVLYEEALRLDPTAILAMTGVANGLIHRTSSVNTINAGDEIGRAAKLIADAAAIDPNHPFVLDAAASLRFAQGRYTEAVSAYQRILDEYPNWSSAYSQIGSCLLYTGRAAEAIPMIEMAIRRDPRASDTWDRYGQMSLALLVLERDEEAIVWSQRALAAVPADYRYLRTNLNLRIAAAHARLGRLEEARRALVEANRIWPHDTARGHWPEDPSSRTYAAQIGRFQAALRLAGHRDHAEEDADFGGASDDSLREDLAGLTPTTVPGATTVRTAELQKLLAEQKPVAIDLMMYWWGRSIPGAVGLRYAGWGGSSPNAMQDRLRRKMQELTRGDLSTPVVAIGYNSERFDGRNLALRLVALGYTNVYWYRGGREAWEVAGLPEAEIKPEDW